MKAVNLIPSEQRSGQPVGAGRSQGAAYAVLALLAGAAVIAYSYGHAAHQVESNKTQVASLKQEAQQERAAAERLAPYTSFVAAREARVQATQTLIDSRFDWAHAFHEFGRVLPSGVSITALAGTIGAATGATSSTSTPAGSSASAGASSVSSATPAGSVPAFTISGCATSQPTVATMLQRLRLIDGVKEVTLQSSTGSSTGASSASGGCGGPVFSATVTFEPLPSSSAIQAANTRTVADTAAGGGGRVDGKSAGAGTKGTAK